MLALTAAGFMAGGQGIMAGTGTRAVTLMASAAGQRPTDPGAAHSLGRGMILWY
jgi:hypothetical protein